MTRTTRFLCAALAATVVGNGAALSAGIITKQEIIASSFSGEDAAREVAGTVSPLVLKVQILLDRAGISPGVIDGLDGDNYRAALRGFERKHSLPTDGRLDSEVWTKLTGSSAHDVVTDYALTKEDLAQTPIKSIPDDFGEMAKLESLPYTGVVEMLAERFHMDEDLLRGLNPGAKFDSVGSVIVVADAGTDAPVEPVTRIRVDGAAGTLSAYGADDRLVYLYPASVGSASTPSPSGTHKVRAVAIDPVYTYRPDTNFKQGDNDSVLTIPPGPNGPVGSVWIDLSKPTYGIHGTAEPAEIGKTESHGCVRLTNWDAAELAKAVSKGTLVEFLPGT